MCGPDFLEVPEIRASALNQLRNLKSKYNIILRLHPLSRVDDVGDFILAPKNKFPSFKQLIEISDIIIGPPNGVLCTATSYFDKYIVCIPAEHNKDKYHEYLGRNIDYVLNDKNCKILYGEELLNSNSLKNAIDISISNHNSYAKERKKYVDFMFYCIDGYENIRTITKIIKKVTNLQFKSSVRLSNCT